MTTIKLFTTHPNTVGETYFEHMQSALWFASRLFAAAMYCLVHAAFPFMFERSGSRIIAELHDRMIVNRDKRS